MYMYNNISVDFTFHGSSNIKICLYIIGAGVFVTTVVAGTVMVIKPFYMAQRPFLRDIVCYLASVYFAFYILYDRKITTAEAIG